MYTCHIEEIDQSEMRNKLSTQDDKVAENHTVTCHENEIDIFKSVGFENNLDTSKQPGKAIISPGSGSSQKIKSNSKENTSSSVLCPRVSNVEAKKQPQRTVIPSPTNLNVSKTAPARTSNTAKVAVSKNNPLPRTSQNVPNPRMSTLHHIPGTLHANILSNTRTQAAVRVTTPNVSRTALSRTPITAKCSMSSITPARSVSTLQSVLSSSGAFPRASNVRNISPMDLLIDLTKPKPNSGKTTYANQTQSLKFVITPQQSNVGPVKVTASTGISPKWSRALNPRSTIASRVNTVRTVRSTPIPLAPKPTTYTPVTFLEQFPNHASNHKRLLAPKPITVFEPKTTHPPQQTRTPPLVFHSTEFVPQGNTSKVVQVKTRTIPGSVPFSSSSQVTNRPTHVAQNRSQGTPPASSIRPAVPVTTNVVQLCKTPTQPKFKQVLSNVVKVNSSPSQTVSKPNQITSKIVQLNTDPAQLAANFHRLRAKATQEGSKTIPLVSTQSNSAHHKTSSPVLSVSQHVPVPTQHSPTSELKSSSSQAVSKPNQITSKIVQLNTDPAQLAANFLRLRAKATQGGSKTIPLVSTQSNSAHHKTSSPLLSVSQHVPVPTQHSPISGSRTSTPIFTTHKVSHTGSVIPTKNLSQTLTSVAAVKGSSDSDGMAVVVGSPEQITKLLSENPTMIELLGCKSTDFLGKLLTSHSKKESCVRQLIEASTSGGQQNKCESIKEALKRPSAPIIDLTKSPSKHVIDLTKDKNIYPKSSKARSLPSTLTPSSLSSVLNPSSMPSTLISSSLSSVLTPSSLSSTPSSLPSTSSASSMSLTPSSSVKANKIDLTKCRNAVRKLDRSCLNSTFGIQRPMQSIEAVSLGKPVQSGIKSPTLDVHPTAHTPAGATSNPQYIFHNRRFLHANLDTPSLEKKANRVSPLSSPTKIMAHIEDQSKNMKPVVLESQQGVDYYQKLQASKQQGKEDKTLNNGKTGSISKKDIVKSRGKRTYTKRTYTKRKGLDKDTNDKTKKSDGQVSTKRKSDGNCLRTVKRTKIDEDDIVLPDFARVKQSDLRSKRLEKVNQELNVMFIITSEEGLEVKARTCEGILVFFIWPTSDLLNRLALLTRDYACVHPIPFC